MPLTNKNEALLLFLGDIFFFLLSLWLMLFIRYWAIPGPALFSSHIVPFSILFVFWVIVFFISGLYEKHTLILRSRIPTLIFNAQIVNSALAILFFYFIPFFGITPKTELFLYVIISFALLLYWRIVGISILHPKGRENAILIGSGEEMQELKEEVNNNARYGLYFVSSVDINNMENVDFQEEILKRVYSENIQIIAADFKNDKVEPILPNLYNLIFSKVRFIDMYKIYEDIFDRIPMSLVQYNWFLENISVSADKMYDSVKRALDIAVSLITGVVSLIFYPFIIAAILLDDGRPFYFVQDRIGKNKKVFKTYKFRSFPVHNESDGIAKNLKVTRIGNFLRKTRLDELPQIWSVFNGDLSLIGPRPEIPALAATYEKEIPYYNVRHLIKPGLSGWAQLYQKDPPRWAADLSKTKLKLSYDLYYLKNRSVMLDLKIALKTIKTLLSRQGI